MFGIIDDNNKFILLDSDHDKLRTTALMLAKVIEEVVPDYDEQGEQIGEHIETKYVPMFDEDTVDEAIKEYADGDIETAYNGEKYLAGNAPAPDHEAQRQARERAFVQEADPLRYAYEEDVARYGADSEQALESKETWLAKKDEIRQLYPYPTDPITNE